MSFLHIKHLKIGDIRNKILILDFFHQKIKNLILELIVFNLH